MKPWQAECFDWNEGNERELAAHQITVSEVEELFYGDPTWSPNRKERSGAWKMVGFTGGGRALTIVVEVAEHSASIRAVTGWDCTQGERTRYMKGQR